MRPSKLSTTMRMVRIGFVLGAVALVAAACQAVLDIGRLNKQPAADGAAQDQSIINRDGPIVVDGPAQFADVGGNCKAGVNCDVPGLKGACRNSSTTCNNGVAECLQKVQPSVEKCDGVDSDCDGIPDQSDPDVVCASGSCGAKNCVCSGSACVPFCLSNGDCQNSNTCQAATGRCVCGVGNGCTGNMLCVNNTSCQCNGKITCGPTETCQTTGCACGTKISTTGAVCTGSNPNCVGTGAAGTCACAAITSPTAKNLVCRANETCSGSGNAARCACGTKIGAAGEPACPAPTTCNVATSTCISPDAGPADGTIKADGVKADGVKADGIKADGVKSDL